MNVGAIARACRRLILGTLLLPLSAVHAGTISYVATPLGANLWRYDYTVTNAIPSIAFDELTVYFDVGRFEMLAEPTAPAGWDPIVVQPDPGIPSSGFYDALNLGAPLGAGATVSGFSVSFAYLGVGSPGAQSFDLLDSATFSVVHSGTTAPIPEPASFAMILMGLLGVSVAGRFSNRTAP